MANDQNLIPLNSETAKVVGALGGAAKKGSKHLSTWIQEMLNDEEFETTIIDAKTGIREFKGAPLKAIIQAQTHLALHSKDENVRIKASDLLFKHGYGTKQVLSNDPDAPIGIADPATAAGFADFLKQKTADDTPANS